MGAEQSKKSKQSSRLSPRNSNSLDNSTLNQTNQSIKSTHSLKSNSSITSKSSVTKQSLDPLDKIVVVSKGENQKDESLIDKEFINHLLNNHFNSLIPKNNQDVLPENYQQIDSISMTNLCKFIQTYLKEKSELSVKEQNLIYEKIKKIDYVTAFIANLIIEKEKTQIKTIDIVNKFNELKLLTKTYQTDIDKCFENLNKLNNLLDDDNKIELNLN